MHDPRRSRRSVARDPIVHGLSKREKKKKQAKCREFVECLQSTTASGSTCPPGYPHHTLSNVTAHRNRPAPPRAHVDATRVPLRFAAAQSSEHIARPTGIASRASHADRYPPFVERLRAHRHRSASARHVARDMQPPTAVAFDGCLAVPLAFIRVQPHSDTMHPLTSALAKSRPQFDSRPRACAHPSVLPPPVAPPLVCAAPPPSAARAG